MYQTTVMTKPEQAQVSYEEIRGQTVSCKQCGKRIPYAELYEVNAFVYLCPDCFRGLEMLSQRFREYLSRGVVRKVIAENKQQRGGEKKKIFLSSVR